VLLCARRGYAAVLGDQNNAWADGTLSAAEIANDPEAAALALSFQQQIAAQFGATPDQIDITGLHADRRLLDSAEDVELTIAYTAPHTGKFL